MPRSLFLMKEKASFSGGLQWTVVSRLENRGAHPDVTDGRDEQQPERKDLDEQRDYIWRDDISAEGAICLNLGATG